jgi:hypothetical protein
MKDYNDGLSDMRYPRRVGRMYKNKTTAIKHALRHSGYVMTSLTIVWIKGVTK